MLKWLAISGVIIFGLLPVHGQEKAAKSDAEQKKSEPGEQKELKAISVSVINTGGQQTSQGKSDNVDNHAASYLSRLFSPENAPNIGLFFVGVIGSLIALRTLKNIERQTESSKTAADAALLNAQAVINAERPWLLVVIEPVEGPMGGFNIFIKNKGRTPAMITAAYIGCVRVKDISHLPKEPPYKPGSVVYDLIVIPDEKPSILWFDGSTLNKMLGDTRIPSWEGQTFVFSRIVYRDLADPTPERIHETRSMGIHYGPTENDSDSISQIEGIGAPEEYAKYS